MGLKVGHASPVDDERCRALLLEAGIACGR